MKRSIVRAGLASISGVSLILIAVWLLSGHATNLPMAHAAELRVCSNGCAYSSIQAAVDAAGDGDLIKVAEGIYTGVNVRPRHDIATTGVVTQMVYISKTVTIQGGYTTTNWTTPYPVTQPVTLDAQGQGRVLYITGNISPTVEALHITDGRTPEIEGVIDEDSGGGLYVITAAVTLHNNEVYSNTAFYGGGGLYAANSHLVLRSNTFISSGAFSGGGLYLSSGAAALDDNTVTGNTAYLGGGGLVLDSTSAVLSNNTVTSNTIPSFGPVISRGGGIYLSASTATLSGNIVANNIADGGRGGGLYLGGGSATLSDNIITSNMASNGGGIYLSLGNDTLSHNTVASNIAPAGSGLYLFRSAAKLVSNLVVSNTGSMGGAGLYLESSPATLSNNIVVSNTMLDNGDGGGLHLSSSAATLSGNRVIANTAPFGGGLALIGSDATLINNVVADNQASSWGSGLLVVNSLPHLLHTTIARNGGGDGSGVYVTSYITKSVVGMTNTILVSQTVGITVVAGNTATLQGTLWGSDAWANGANWGGDGTIVTGTVNIFGDPAFVNPDAGDYHIGSSSAARDVGVNAGVRIDIDNEPRPVTGVDIGADEYWAPGTLKHIYLPLVLKNEP
jgi:parallel beta-helix repeat protein